MSGRVIDAVLGAAVLVALTASCPASARKAADGYEFGAAEYVKTDLKVRIVEHPSYREVMRAGLAAGAVLPPEPGVMNRDRAKIGAFSILRPDGCEIHIISAAVDYRPDLLGHELAHCIYGRWHP